MREKDLKSVKEGLGDLAAQAEMDHEIQMARSELYKIAKYAIKLHEMLKGRSEAQGLEAWQQSKITKAADYIGSVYHNLEYEMKFGEQMAEGKKAKPDFLDMDKDGNKKEPMKKAVADKKKGVAEGEKRMSRAAKGHEKYGKEGMEALAKAGRNGASEKELDSIRDKHDKYDESVSEEKQKGVDGKACWDGYKRMGTKQKGGKTVDNCVKVKEDSYKLSLAQQLDEKSKSKAQQKFMGMVYAAKKGEKPASKDVAKVAKGISKSDAKDFASTKHKGKPEHVKKD
jgi:hypothetical protein